MLSLVNRLEAAAGATATVLQFGYAVDWPIIGSIGLQYGIGVTRLQERNDPQHHNLVPIGLAIAACMDAPG